MKKRIGRRQLIENLRMALRQRDDAIIYQKSAEDAADRLREQNSAWRDRLEKLENNPELQYVGIIPGCTLIKTAMIDYVTAAKMKDEKTTREYIRCTLAGALVGEIIEQGLMRVEIGGELDPFNPRKESFNTVRIVARLDVVPWDRLVRRTANSLMIQPRDFYEKRIVPPVYDDMIRNEELAQEQDAPRPWE